jgi:hypothetical protein
VPEIDAEPNGAGSSFDIVTRPELDSSRIFCAAVALTRKACAR